MFPPEISFFPETTVAMAFMLDDNKAPRSIRPDWPARLGGHPISHRVKRLNEDNTCKLLRRAISAQQTFN